MGPSTPQEPSVAETRDCAKVLPHATASMRDLRRHHMKKRAALKGRRCLSASSRGEVVVDGRSLFHHPNGLTSRRRTTTRRQRSPLTNSTDFRSLSVRALTNTAPFTVAAFGQTWEADVRADRTVMSHSDRGGEATWSPTPRSSAGRCWNSDVYVMKTDVAPETATFMSCLPAHSCKSSLRTNCSGPQRPGLGEAARW